ncbi:hypothetical protein [Marinimicrobium sp. C2-29]|uniref:hypothetical protein n=1 Tax=Marinimicrobium sp. C2-29 TaxID=3139825 RepID=UPI0031388318
MTYIGPTSTLPPSARTKINTTRAHDQTLPVSEQVFDTTPVAPIRERRRADRRRHRRKPLVEMRSEDRRQRRKIDIEV